MNGQLQLTGVTTTLPLLIGASEAMLKATIVVAQRYASLACVHVRSFTNLHILTGELNEAGSYRQIRNS